MKNELIDKLLELVNNTQDFFTAQTPEYIRQLLAYDIWAHTVGAYVGTALLVIAFISLIGLLFAIHNKEDNWQIASALILMATFIIGMVIFISCTFTLKKIEIAPKVYIIDYLNSQIRK